MEPKPGHRVAWLFALGYFAFYAPYSALIKLITGGHLSGVPAGLQGLDLLPAVIGGTILAMLLFLALTGWWQYARRPSAGLVVSGIGSGIIIATTTIAYTFHGVSIVFALLLMRGGVLILAPFIDLAMHRTVRWFCWSALAMSAIALGIAFSDVGSYELTPAALLNLGGYLFGYVLRLPMMTRLAKIENATATRRYLVTEMLVAMAVLAAFPFAAAALVGQARSLWQTAALPPALLIGVLYAGLYVFGTLIYLDRRENTFCIPLNRGASLLAGVVAAYALSTGFGMAPPAGAQLIAVIPIVAALALLSPAHHVFEFARAMAAIQKKRVP